MIEFFRPNKIIVGYSKVIPGRGVFATEDFKKGDLVERCPMVQMGWRSNYLKDPVIWQYLYTDRCDCNDCKNHGSLFYMVLGYGMLYNHQDYPNCDWKFNYKELYADVVANTKIKKDEEIFVSYGSNYFRDKEKITAPTAPLSNELKSVVDIDDDEKFMEEIKTRLDKEKLEAQE